MKKYILPLFIFSFSLTAFAQASVEAFVINSSPVHNWTSTGTTVIEIEDGATYEIPDDELFKTFAKNSFGGGVNLRYTKNDLAVGMEMSYVEYNPASELVRLIMLRVTPIVEYYFNTHTQFQPYVGGSFGLQQTRAYFNQELTNSPRISNTYVELGARAGLKYVINDKWAINTRAKYVITDLLPYFDFSVGVVFDFGDF